MDAVPQSPSEPRPQSRDTGFPAPFCGNRNTRLPHPDADTSPGACIAAEDIAVTKTMHRSRLSFLSKHRRTLSHGKILQAQDCVMYGGGSPGGGDGLGRPSSSLSAEDDDGRKLAPPETQKRWSVLQKLRMQK